MSGNFAEDRDINIFQKITQIVREIHFPFSFRLREPDSPKGGTLPRLNPKFRYSDRTLFQLRQGAYNTLPRPSTLNRRWSDKYSDRRRPTQRSEGDDEAANRRKNEV